MRPTDVAAPSNSIEHLFDVLAHIQHLSGQTIVGANPSKHQQIRVTHWVRKLRSQPTSNPTWLKSVLEYATVLLHMAIEEPFTKMPPQGPLAALSRHQVARLTKTVRQFASASGRPRASPSIERLGAARQRHSNNSAETLRPLAVVRKVSKQIQTQEQDDQWEWQRVWKAAFDKLRQQLQDKATDADALATENKEIRAQLAAHQKALDEAERDRRDAENKHQAELENLRAVHALELRDLQTRHRQKLQEVALQTDEKLLGRRRFTQLATGAGADAADANANANANADFLHYIDAFYSATLHLTAQNKV